MVKKGKKFNTYSVELKLKAMKMKEEGYTHAHIPETLGITDRDRVKV
jgi:transposase